MAELLVVILLPLLLVASAGWDLASFTIPNFLNLAVVGAFLLFAAVAGLSLPLIGWHLLAGLLGLALVSQCSRWAGSAAATPSCLQVWRYGWVSAI